MKPTEFFLLVSFMYAAVSTIEVTFTAVIMWVVVMVCAFVFYRRGNK